MTADELRELLKETILSVPRSTRPEELAKEELERWARQNGFIKRPDIESLAEVPATLTHLAAASGNEGKIAFSTVQYDKEKKLAYASDGRMCVKSHFPQPKARAVPIDVVESAIKFTGPSIRVDAEFLLKLYTLAKHAAEAVSQPDCVGVTLSIESDRLAFKVDGDDTIVAVGAVMGLQTKARDPHGLTK